MIEDARTPPRGGNKRLGAPKLRKADIADLRAAARQWRIDNKPYFDSIYGPESGKRRDCLACGGTGQIGVRQ